MLKSTSFLSRVNQVPVRAMSMVKITEGVEFDTIAREWRMKWSAANDKKSLATIQATLNRLLPAIKNVNGVKSVQRIVCGGCLDYKIIVALPVADFKAWEAASFAPEADFLAELKKIPEVSTIETQTYTIMSV